MIPVQSLYEYLEMMLRDEWGYIYGTAGEMWTEAKQNALRDRYSEDDKNYGASVRYGKKWINHMVTDCSGVMVYIWKQYGLKIPHGSSSMVRQGYIIDCGSEPHPGWAAIVDPDPATPENNHIGIVGPDGVTVYEAKGARYGFVISKVTDPRFTKFGRFKDVDYTGGDQPVCTPYKASVTIKSGYLNVRSGPGKEYSKIAKLNNGDIVTVQAETAGWSYINDPVLGYCASQYLTPIAQAVQQTSAPSQADEPEYDEWANNPIMVSDTGTKIELYGKWKMELD